MSTIAHTAGYSSAKPQAFTLTQWSYRAVVTIAIALYILLALALGRTRAPDADEALFADPALNLITNGSMGTRILETAGTPWKGQFRRSGENAPRLS